MQQRTATLQSCCHFTLSWDTSSLGISARGEKKENSVLLGPVLKGKNCPSAGILCFLPEASVAFNSRMTSAIQFLASSGRQGSIFTTTRRWQCRNILQTFIANPGKLNFRLFPGSLLGYMNLPPSPRSLFGGWVENLFSWSWSFNFAINNNMGEGRQDASCF